MGSSCFSSHTSTRKIQPVASHVRCPRERAAPAGPDRGRVGRELYRESPLRRTGNVHLHAGRAASGSTGHQCAGPQRLPAQRVRVSRAGQPHTAEVTEQRSCKGACVQRSVRQQLTHSFVATRIPPWTSVFPSRSASPSRRVYSSVARLSTCLITPTSPLRMATFKTARSASSLTLTLRGYCSLR